MLLIFHFSGKTPWMSKDLKIRKRGSVKESSHNLIMRIEILSNPWALARFNDQIIEVLWFFLMETVFKCLSVFINNKGGLLLFFKRVHWEAKTWLRIFIFSIVFVIFSPDRKIRGTEGVIFRTLLRNFIQKVIQDDPIDFLDLCVCHYFLWNLAHFCISYKVSKLIRYSA